MLGRHSVRDSGYSRWDADLVTTNKLFIETLTKKEKHGDRSEQ